MVFVSDCHNGHISSEHSLKQWRSLPNLFWLKRQAYWTNSLKSPWCGTLRTLFTLVGPGRLAARKEKLCSQFLCEWLKAVICWTSVDALHCITKPQQVLVWWSFANAVSQSGLRNAAAAHKETAWKTRLLPLQFELRSRLSLVLLICKYT